MKFPKHTAGLTLTHNDHKTYYCSVVDHLGDFVDGFGSPEAMQRSIDTDELWELHWYPDTPVGFLHICAPTLEELEQMIVDGISKGDWE